ncbi:hypothetical protein [Piscibacillus halophilus]|uniref:Uncharacterized protein n=1 Tax=Piscibacillus halophilus TaxID=571933 RepID=A0A1H9EXE7_9BACI|nr:hypothetical protein [Piscibacillus halophilus]SEQ29658.1 hypothetical protein SAMN05216362_11058 [Piscibacillus halophilus]
MIKKYKPLLYIILIVILLLIVFKQHEEKSMYEKHISLELNNDIQSLTNGIISNYNILDEIINSGKITKQQAQLLTQYSKDIVLMVNKYENLAISFNRPDNSHFNNETFNQAQKIFSFFFSIKGRDDFALDEMDETLIELDSKLTKDIKTLMTLHHHWLEASENHIYGVTIMDGYAEFQGNEYLNYYGDHSVTDLFWSDFIVELNEKTKIFLDQYEVNHIEELFEY